MSKPSWRKIYPQEEMHIEAKQAVQKAKQLILAADPDSLRYACLQLRTAIEHLFYELIPLYSEELPTDILDKWQPKQVIDALVDCDPLVESDTQIWVSDYDEQGQPNAPQFLGEQKAVSRKLLKDYYHALGSYLHAPLPGKGHDYLRLQRRLDETAAAVENRCSGRLLSNFGAKYNFSCICGRKVVRNARAIEKSPIVICPDSKCGANYKSYRSEDGMWDFELLVVEWTCGKCNAVNELGRHLVKNGQVVSCEKCQFRMAVRSGFELVPIE